jgi:hypothetical protein
MRIGVTWLITMEGEVVVVVGGGTKSTTGIRSFNLRKSPFTKIKKIRLNQSLTYKVLR